MNIKFSKYQGAGNDFIIINLLENLTRFSAEQIAFLCDRRFGIGADGLMTVSQDENSDFYMNYYNSDGNEGTMCGNGGRCIAKYAYLYGLSKQNLIFNAIDGIHKAIVDESFVSLWMNDVNSFEKYDDGYFLDTGSPHFVKFVKNLSDIDVKKEGKDISFDKRFAPARTNVNFVEKKDNKFYIATFERGVEDETLACGTGSVAAAIALFVSGLSNEKSITINAKGGVLNVSFQTLGNSFNNIVLTGPAVHVYDGEILL